MVYLFVAFVGGKVLQAREQKISKTSLGWMNTREEISGKEVLEETLRNILRSFAGMALMAQKRVERKPIPRAQAFQTFGGKWRVSPSPEHKAPMRAGKSRKRGRGDSGVAAFLFRENFGAPKKPDRPRRTLRFIALMARLQFVPVGDRLRPPANRVSDFARKANAEGSQAFTQADASRVAA